MEEWQLDFEWLQMRHQVKDKLNREALPDMNGLLFLIGIQELGKGPSDFSKEQKQDLMHIAVCTLLAEDGYYEFRGMDADGWPHWDPVRPVEADNLKAQELLLKEKIIKYFKNIF